jgi:hypothetical protein
MTVWSDYVGYARFGAQMFAISTHLLHTPPFHWLIDSIFAGLRVAMTAVRIALVVALIWKIQLATLGHVLASGGSAKSASLAAALPGPKPLFQRRESKAFGNVGRTMPLGLALLAGIGSLGAANLEAGAGLAHFAAAVAAVPIISAAAWSIFQQAQARTD